MAETVNLSRRSETFTSFQENIDDNKDQPLFQLLKRFGQIIPQCHRDVITPQGLSNSLSGILEEPIEVSFICFHAINVVAGIRIEWVDCLSQHLEFDSRSKTLKLCRFPALCVVMFRNNNRSLLSQ
jgi:hypothetical protein